MKVSIEEIARLSGVSTGTISRVLNNRSGVSEETAARVRAIMAEHEYAPRFTTKEQNTIGIAIKGYTNVFDSFYVSQLMNGILNTTFLANYDTKILTYDSLTKSGLNFRTAMRLKNVNGLLLVGSHADPEIIDHLSDTEVPSVVVGNRCEGKTNVSWIDADHELAMKTAVNHLYGLGHRSIACAIFSLTTPSQAIRIRAFESSMRSLFGSFSSSSFLMSRGTSFADGFDLFHRLQNESPKGQRPSAIVVTNEKLSIGMLDAANKAGVAVPNDLSIMNVGQSAIFPYLSPAVTSAEADTVQMGARAVQILLSNMNKTKATIVQELVPVELKVRGSCTHPKP